jgi:hypothetical protein
MPGDVEVRVPSGESSRRNGLTVLVCAQPPGPGTIPGWLRVLLAGGVPRGELDWRRYLIGKNTSTFQIHAPLQRPYKRFGEPSQIPR